MPNPKRTRYSCRTAFTACCLFGLWVVLSGKFDAFHLGIGAVAAALVSFEWRGRVVRDGFSLVGLAIYLPWLLGQIILANLHVARLVCGPAQAMTPRLMHLKPGVRGDRAIALLGCSITLTPGTLTVDASSGEMLVHALDGASAEGVVSGRMGRHAARVFRKKSR